MNRFPRIDRMLDRGGVPDMKEELNVALQRLAGSGWKISFLVEPKSLPETLKKRYPWLPVDVEAFISCLEEACRGDEKVWILSIADYQGESDSAFAWNEWELLSIEDADGDEQWIEQIREFWNEHLPIALSVADGYSFYALKSDQSVVFGREPDFEDTTQIAPSFAQFLDRLAHPV